MEFYYSIQGGTLVYSDWSEDSDWIPLSSINSLSENVEYIQPSANLINKIERDESINFSTNSKSWKKLDLSGFIWRNTLNISRLAYGCNDLSIIIFPEIDGYDFVNEGYLAEQCGSNSDTLNIDFNSNSSVIFRHLLNNCLYKDVKVTNFDESNTTGFYTWFNNCNNLESVNLGELNFVDNTYIIVSEQNLSSNSIFTNLPALSNVILPQLYRIRKFYPYNILGQKQYLSFWFDNCGDQLHADLVVNYNFSNLADFGGMFHNCKYTTITLQNLITHSTDNYQSAFIEGNNHYLTTIYAERNFDIMEGADVTYCFNNLNLLVGAAGYDFATHGRKSAEFGKINTEEVEGYFTQYLSPNRTDVIFIPQNSGEAVVTERGLASDVRIISIEPYTYSQSEIYSPNGELLDTVTTEFFTVQRTTTGVYLVKAYMKEKTQNPYEGGGNSDTSGDHGTGTWDKSTDIIPFGDLPTLDGMGKFLHAYTITDTELDDMQTDLWGQSISGVWQQIWGKPISYISSLGVLPVTPDLTTQDENIALGRFKMPNAQARPMSSRWKRWLAGSIEIRGYSGSYLDYSPYTSCQIFLPYVGYRSLSIDDVMDRTLTVQYDIDCITGDCIAKIYTSTNGVIATFAGNMLTQMPYSGEDVTGPLKQLASGMLGVAVGSLGMLTGNVEAGGQQLSGARGRVAAAGATTGTIIDTAQAVSASKPQPDRGSSLGGTTGLLGIQVPYLIFVIPNCSIPENYRDLEGLPINATYTLAQLSGFTAVEAVDIEGIPALNEEIEEIKQWLVAGVIL